MTFQKNNNRLFHFITQQIILFLALLMTIITLTDITNFLVVLNVLPHDFSFSSGNFELVQHMLSYYKQDAFSISCILFSIIIGWIFITAIAYWYAFISFFHKRPTYVYNGLMAFGLHLALMMLFILTDEMFIQYKQGHGHMQMLIFVMVSLFLFVFFSQPHKD